MGSSALHRVLVLFASLIAMPATAWDQAESTILLNGLDSAAGVKLSWGTELPETRIEVNTDRRFVSEGAASLHLASRGGKQAGRRYYAGIRIPLQAVVLDGRSLMLDCWTSRPAATQAIYVRLYGAKNRKLADWTNWSQPFRHSPRLTIRLDLGLDRDGFEWSSQGIQGHEEEPIEAVEIIIGTQDAGAALDLYVDNLRLTTARYQPFTRIRTPKRLYRQVPLVQNGQAVSTIIVPDLPEYLELAARLRSRIQELSGAKLPLLRASQATRPQIAATESIFLGNVANNRAMTELYALLYTPVDDSYPPGDGYLVHTVHDPWGTGHGALVLGASSLPGARKAVEALLKTLQPGRDLILPKLNLFELGAAETRAALRLSQPAADRAIRAELEQARRLFQSGGHRTVAGRMADLGFQYARTGNDLAARLYKELAVAWYESYQAKPPIYGGPWGMDMDFHLMEILPAWDLVEESPALSDDDRMRVTRILYEFITTDVVRKASGALQSTQVRNNHTTFPALGLFYAGRYFAQGYGCPEADHWLDVARACFTLQARAAKPYENCNGYGWLVPYHTMRYSLATGDSAYFDNGNVRFQADYAILTMDNLGYQVPYGDTGSYQCWWSELPFLRGAEFYHRDGRWAWTLEKKLAVHPDSTRFQYACRVTPKEPADLLGARAIPLDKMYWETFAGPQTIPLEKTVDKVVMRASFAPDRQYLLLDGLSNGGHMHFDGNSISRITDRGRIWLADNDYIRSLPKFHNSVLVFKDGEASTLPPYCELEALADGARFGIAQTVVRNYAGVDWHRSILWGKERFFLVLDELTAREAARYDFHGLWHTVGEARLAGRNLQVEQQGPRMCIKSLPGPRLRLTDDVELGKNWVGYAFAAPVVRRLREVQSASLAVGDHAALANLLYTSDAADPREFEIIPVGAVREAGGATDAWAARAVIVRANGKDMLAGVGEPDQSREVLPGVRIAAKAFLLGESHGLAACATLISCGDRALRSTRPLNVELSDGRIELSASAPARVELLGGWDRPVATGGVVRITAEGGKTLLELSAGKSTISTGDTITLPGLSRKLAAVPLPAAAQATPTEDVAVMGSKLQWSFRPGGEAILALAVGDLDGDGRDQVIVASDHNRAYCLGSDGARRWQFATQGPVTTAAVADFEHGKPKTVVIGSEDCHVYALDPSGKLQWSFAMPTYKNPGRVRVLFAADLNGDGSDAVIAGGDNWRYYALDRHGRELWHYESVHPSTAGAAADLDGDGRKEILCGTAYYWWHCADAGGNRRWQYSTKMPHATVALSARRDGSKQRVAIFGAEDGSLHVLDAAGNLLWKASVGDEVTAAVAADFRGQRRDDIVAASLSFNVVAFDTAGRRLWRRNLDDAVLSLAVADINGDGRPEIIAGCDDGRIVVLDGRGRTLVEYRAAAAVSGLTTARTAAGPAVIARTTAGEVLAVSFQPPSRRGD